MAVITFDPTPESVAVVGEASYQGNLEALAGGRDSNGPRIPDHLAYLIPEPTNPYDPNAVRVILTRVEGGRGALVGYLSREDAVAYRPVIDRVAAGGRLVRCRAFLRGGRDRGDGRPDFFGAWLSLGTPAALMRVLDASEMPPNR